MHLVAPPVKTDRTVFDTPCNRQKCLLTKTKTSACTCHTECLLCHAFFMQRSSAVLHYSESIKAVRYGATNICYMKKAVSKVNIFQSKSLPLKQLKFQKAEKRQRKQPDSWQITKSALMHVIRPYVRQAAAVTIRVRECSLAIRQRQQNPTSPGLLPARIWSECRGEDFWKTYRFSAIPSPASLRIHGHRSHAQSHIR